MKGLSCEKRVFIILLGILLLGVLPLVAVIVLWPGFRVYDFEQRVTQKFGEEIVPKAGNICYGNMLSCHEVEISSTLIDEKKLGEQTIFYTYSYKDKKLEKSQILEIKDESEPLITLEEESIIYCPNKKVQEYHVKAMDDYDGDITSKIKTTLEEKEMIFEVEDSSENKTIKKVPAVLKDEEKPTLILQGNTTISLEINQTYQEQGAIAQDNCDGDISSKIKIIGSVDNKHSGEYKITYQVEDSLGNKAEKTRTIYVYQKNNTVVPNKKVVYLTFDDGPGPYTKKLLDTLQKYNVKATFFVTDQNMTKGYDELIKRAYKEGHSIGLHTKTHDYSQIYTSKEAYFEDLYAIQQKVKNITGYTSYLMRFPGGSSNTVSKNYDRGNHIMSELTKAVEAKGFVYFDWNVSSGDAGETTLSSKVISNVIEGISRVNIAVVLQHDVKSFSVDAVESIIQYGLSHGYQFLPLTKTSPTMHHGVNN